jgi:hypothetical protein
VLRVTTTAGDDHTTRVSVNFRMAPHADARSQLGSTAVTALDHVGGATKAGGANKTRTAGSRSTLDSLKVRPIRAASFVVGARVSLKVPAATVAREGLAVNGEAITTAVGSQAITSGVAPRHTTLRLQSVQATLKANGSAQRVKVDVGETISTHTRSRTATDRGTHLKLLVSIANKVGFRGTPSTRLTLDIVAAIRLHLLTANRTIGVRVSISVNISTETRGYHRGVRAMPSATVSGATRDGVALSTTTSTSAALTHDGIHVAGSRPTGLTVSVGVSVGDTTHPDTRKGLIGVTDAATIINRCPTRAGTSVGKPTHVRAQSRVGSVTQSLSAIGNTASIGVSVTAGSAGTRRGFG